ncbi:MAG: hypothetical protein HQ478_05755 [Chloroflexi bacterium]|nr:hypothetical protein [Chloroflexota bacterium]
MPRAQDMLNEAISITEGAASSSGDERLSGLIERMQAQSDKFFFMSLAGVPLANKAKKAAAVIASSADDSTIGALEAIVAEIEEKSDAPGTVLT